MPLTIAAQHVADSLRWRHNERYGVSNHMRLDGLLNRLFRRRSKKKFRVIGLCARNSPVTGEFPSQKTSNAEIFPFDDVIMLDQYLIASELICVDETTLLTQSAMWNTRIKMPLR